MTSRRQQRALQDAHVTAARGAAPSFVFIVRKAYHDTHATGAFRRNLPGLLPVAEKHLADDACLSTSRPAALREGGRPEKNHLRGEP
jgi:hypothetical protein